MIDESEVTIEFKGRHDQISERMKANAVKKIARLRRFGDRLARIEVVADHAHKNPEVELIVHFRRGAPLVSRDRATSFSSTIDLLVDKVETLLRKQKEKRTDRKTAGQRAGKSARTGGRGGKADRGAEEETYEEVVRKSLRR